MEVINDWLVMDVNSDQKVREVINDQMVREVKIDRKIMDESLLMIREYFQESGRALGI